MVDTVFGRILVPLMGWHAQPSTPWDAPARMHVSRTSVSRAAPQPGAQAARRKAQAVGQPGPGGRCAPWFERIWLALGRKPRGVSPRSARAAARPSALRAVCMRWLRAGASLPFDADKKKRRMAAVEPSCVAPVPHVRPAAGLCRGLGDVGKKCGAPRARSRTGHPDSQGKEFAVCPRPASARGLAILRAARRTWRSRPFDLALPFAFRASRPLRSPWPQAPARARADARVGASRPFFVPVGSSGRKKNMRTPSLFVRWAVRMARASFLTS